MKGASYLKPVMPVVTGVFSLLLIGAVVFYKERMLFSDAPHILFRIIYLQTIDIQIGRYGSFITQVLPWCGMKLHLPIRILMLLYSAGFVLFPFIIALVLIYKYRRYDLALLLGLYFTMFVSDTYFWTNNELHEGITWLLFAFGIIGYAAQRQRPAWLKLILFLFFFFLAISTHPLVIFAAVYLWFFYWLRGADWPFGKKESVIYSLLLLGIVFLKYKQSSVNWYDSDKINLVTHFPLRKLKAIIHASQFHFFVKHCITDYWLFVILFITGLISLLKERKYLLFLLSVVFTAGYVVLICITYWDINLLKFYMESEYMPLAVIGCAPFVYYTALRLPKRKMVMLFSFIFAVRFIYILCAVPFFHNRVSALRHINEKMMAEHYYKVIIPDTGRQVNDSFMQTWAVPAESIILSALEGQHPQRTFIFMAPDAIRKTHPDNDTLLTSYGKMHYSALNPYYFQIDTTTDYRIITNSDLLK